MSNQRWETTPPAPSLVSPWRRPATEPAYTTSPVIAGEAWEREAIAILERPITSESAAAAHARKEVELKVVFGRLSVLESRALHARLSRGDDALARLIGRMVPERRLRLLSFIADARRREALAALER